MAIAVVITSMAEAPALVGWAWQCARARGEDIVALVPCGKEVAEDAEPVPTIRAAVSNHADAHARMSAVHRDAEQGASKPKEPERCPEVHVVQVKSADPGQGLLDALGEHDAKLLLLAKHAKAKGDEDVLPVKLFREAPCMVVLLRLGGESTGVHCRRVIVPTSGGPHATEALKLAELISELPDTTCPIDQPGPAGVDALYVEPDIGPEAELVGRRILDKAVRRATGDPSAHPHIRPMVQVSKDFREGLAKVVEAGKYDLLLIGAANQWHARKALFGMLPDKMLADDSTLTVGVVRQAKPLMTAAAERIRHLLSRGIPQLEREDRITLVERVQSASEWNVDFVALICLSTAIATLGLMQNSAAVVIGAMLVAPLMTPLIGCGLGVVQGNGRLVQSASKSVLLGFLLAMFIGFAMGTIVPHAGITNEMLSRGKPNALDLAVALISGIAAAYATARPNLLGALPGVAIAAALVPPIATSGVALSDGDLLTAAGAAMLFLTNIVAIVLGAAAALFAVGMQAKHLHAREKRWTRHAIMGLTVGAVVLSVPLLYFLYASLPKDEISKELMSQIQSTIHAHDGVAFSEIGFDRDAKPAPVYTITIAASQDAQLSGLAFELDDVIEAYTNKQCRVSLDTQTVAPGETASE